MAVEPGPNYGTGTGGSSSTGTPTQTDYTDDEVGAYPFDDYTNGNGITRDYTKADMTATGDARRRAYFYATIGILVLLAVR